MRNRAWIAYPLVAAAATVLWFTTGRVSWVFNAIGLASPLLILVALRWWKPSRRMPWIMFAIGLFVFIAGDVVSYNYETLWNARFPGLFPLDADGFVPFPGWADGFYLAVYVFMITGVILLIHARTPGRDTASLVDALMLSIGLGTISWVLLISPQIFAEDVTVPIKLTSMAYPLMDVLLLAAVIRLAVGAGRKPTSFWLMTAAIVGLFATDAVYGWVNLYTVDGYQPGSGPLEAGWMAFYVLFGAAALHPSMRLLSERATETDQRLSNRRLVVLATASLLAPALLAYEASKGITQNFPVLIGATAVLFVLAIIRMWGLMRRQQDSLRREQVLREAGADLVTATSRASIHEAAGRAIRQIAGDEAAVRICEVEPGSDELAVVAAVGGEASLGPAGVRLEDLQDWKRERLSSGHGYRVAVTSSVLAGPLSMPETHGTAFVAPLTIRGELSGLMAASVPGALPRQTEEALETLTSQVALALESATLTEDLLRRESQARFASLVRNSSDLVMVIEPDTTITYASPSADRVLGVAADDLEGTRFADLIPNEDRTRVLTFLTPAIDEDEGRTGLTEFRVNHADGSTRFVETLRTNLLHDANVRGIVLNTRDISERKQFEEQLSHQAFHDAVTGLANRALFRDRVTHALERRSRDDTPVSVLFMDLDDFKTINDSLGHAAGDQLLRELGERLVGRLRTADTAARLGGDEFAVLLEDGGDEGLTAADIAQRILEMLEEPFQLDGTEVFARASIGISVAEPDAVVDAEELLRNADVAMYMAKENGKARYQLFEPAMHDTAIKRLELKAALQRALEHGEFELHYQPVIELETGAMSGVEALIRWNHPDKGMVAPLEFIPLAEETGLIVPIGRWVLTEACRYAAELQTRFPSGSPLHMAVNLSARQVARPELVDDVREILDETGLDPATLVLEITETVMIQDMDLAIARLAELKTLGVQLAIDDFGTGYSSLNYVRRLPVDILKVDKSFIDGVTESGESSALTAAVIELATILNLKPVAEGIERADQLDRLLDLHCALGQGYYFAEPLPGADLEALLTDRRQMQAEAAAIADPAP
jgi:diguanylate cyclase (GGDEF)-like protein/PAS domain S-box-containing protein